LRRWPLEALAAGQRRVGAEKYVVAYEFLTILYCRPIPNLPSEPQQRQPGGKGRWGEIAMITDVSAIEEKRESLRGRAIPALAFFRSNAPAAQVVRFVSHYVQMSIAMMLGMFLPVWGFILAALGLSGLVSRSPEASALVMT